MDITGNKRFFVRKRRICHNNLACLLYRISDRRYEYDGIRKDRTGSLHKRNLHNNQLSYSCGKILSFKPCNHGYAAEADDDAVLRPHRAFLDQCGKILMRRRKEADKNGSYRIGLFLLCKRSGIYHKLLCASCGRQRKVGGHRSEFSRNFARS